MGIRVGWILVRFLSALPWQLVDDVWNEDVTDIPVADGSDVDGSEGRLRFFPQCAEYDNSGRWF
jgi:hypothetical protein